MFGGQSIVEWIALAAIGLLALVVSVIVLIGLIQARSLVRREFNAYFLSPIAYVVLVIFLAVMGALFFLTLDKLTATGPEGVRYPMQFMLGQWWFWLVFLIIPPVLSMRLFAEERSTGTLEVLMTAPLRDWQVVLSKYIACYGFYLLMWLPTLAYLPILINLQPPRPWTLYSGLMAGGLVGVVVTVILAALPIGKIGRILALVLVLASAVCAGVGIWGHYWLDKDVAVMRAGIDPLPVLTSYLGLILAGGMFLAIGLLVSSLVRSQLVACLVSLALSLGFIVAGFWQPNLDHGSSLYSVIYFFSVPLHFDRDFTVGVLDSRHLLLYGSVAVFSLFLTVRSLESRRWQ